MSRHLTGGCALPPLAPNADLRSVLPLLLQFGRRGSGDEGSQFSVPSASSAAPCSCGCSLGCRAPETASFRREIETHLTKDRRGALRPGGDRGGNGGAGVGGGFGGDRGAHGAGRAAPPGRRVPVDRLRAVEGHHPLGLRPPRPAPRGELRHRGGRRPGRLRARDGARARHHRPHPAARLARAFPRAGRGRDRGPRPFPLLRRSGRGRPPYPRQTLDPGHRLAHRRPLRRRTGKRGIPHPRDAVGSPRAARVDAGDGRRTDRHRDGPGVRASRLARHRGRRGPAGARAGRSRDRGRPPAPARRARGSR